MITLFKYRWNRMAVRIAITSFLLGSFLMLIALMSTDDFVITCGITFLALYIPITLILLLVLLVNTLIYFRAIHEHVMTFVIVLINLPIAILYINFINF